MIPANITYRAVSSRYPHFGRCGCCGRDHMLDGVDADLVEEVCASCLRNLRRAESLLVRVGDCRQPEDDEIPKLVKKG